MSIAVTLTLALLAAPAPQAGARPGAAGALQQSRAQEHRALVNEYEAAFRDWKQKLRELRRAKDESWRELRKEPPALVFWPRFEALAEAGQGRALEWMAQQADERTESRAEAAVLKRELYARLFERHGAENWLAGTIARLSKERVYLGEDNLVALLEGVAGREGVHPEVAARALVTLAGELDGRKATEAERKRAEELYLRAHERFPDTLAGREAEQTVFELRHLRPGKPAPDFSAKDADGVEFKLSDYRGKVVLVDFWGFW